MAERKKISPNRLAAQKPTTQEEIDSAEWKEKIARKKDSKLRQKIGRENVRLLVLGVENKRKQQAEKTIRQSPRYAATMVEVAKLGLKAIEVSKHQQAILTAMLTTDDQRAQLESFVMAVNLQDWLNTMSIELERRPALMDSRGFKHLLITCSMYLSEHGDQPD